MADQNPMGHAPRETTAEQDAKTENAVLAVILEEHPAQLTITEVSLVLNAGPNAPESGDAVERAVRELVGAGLLHCRGAFVLPTRAALYFNRLERPE